MNALVEALMNIHHRRALASTHDANAAANLADELLKNFKYRSDRVADVERARRESES